MRKLDMAWITGIFILQMINFPQPLHSGVSVGDRFSVVGSTEEVLEN